MPSLERTLFRAVVAFRLIALLWMAILVAVAVATVPDLRVGVLVALLLVAATATGVLQGAGRRGTTGRGWVAADAAVGLLVAAGPWMAGTTEPFYGGYPASVVVLVAFAVGRSHALALALAQVVVIVAGAAAVGPFDVGDVARSGLTLVITAWVVGFVIDWLRDADHARRRAEDALATEREARVRAEERSALATRLHDSAVQTLVVLRQQADDPERVRSLARRQERELRAVITDAAGGPSGLASRLEGAADDVEDLHGLLVERVVLGDLPPSPVVDAVAAATREALVNVARHAATERAHLFAEVGPGRVTVAVRDHGAGFDPEGTSEGTGLARSIRGRIEAVGGRVGIRSRPGGGTEVEMEVPLR